MVLCGAHRKMPGMSNFPEIRCCAAGNMTHDASHSYFYDAEERLYQVDGTAGYCWTKSGTPATACYVYDAEGRRASRIVGSSQTDYLRDLSGQVISEFNSSTWLNIYLRLNGALFAQYTLGTPRTQFIHFDHLGSTRLITNLSGGVVDSMDYLPFGEQIAGATGTTHKFTGYERDSESNLDNAQARYYGSPLGRFMSPDPVGNLVADPTNPQTWNMYAYTSNNPLSMTDPLGLDSGYNDCIGSGNDPAQCGPPPCDSSGCIVYVWGGSETYDPMFPSVPPCLLSGTCRSGAGHGGGGGGAPGTGSAPNSPQPQTPTPAQAATNYCQQHGQLSFNIPFTHIPVTIGLSATLFGNYGTTNDIALTFPPSAGASLDITVGAPKGFNVPVQVGSGKNLSMGTFLTPSG